MKKLFVILYIIPFSFLKAQVKVVAEQPELNILYRGYDNVIIPEVTGAEENRILVEGTTVTPTTFQGKKGYIVKPGAGTRIVPIVQEAKINGEWIIFDTVFYKVKAFPMVRVHNQTISKSSGVNIQCGLSTSAPIRRSYEVLSVNIQDQDYTGGTIPGKAVKSIKVGNHVGVTVKIKDILTGADSTIVSSLKVTN
jgi:hypothetical protein